MTATTSPSLGIIQDHHQAPHFQLSVFPWHAHLFRAYSKFYSLEFQAVEDPEFPYLAIFQFSCDSNLLNQLIARYTTAGYPFGITNFNRKSETDSPPNSAHP